MSYQGHAVNFSQMNNSDFDALQGLITQVYNSNRDYSTRSDTDIWNHLNRYVWGKSGSQSSPKGNWSADPNAIVPNITKNTNAIKRLESKIDSNKAEHSGFHTKLTDLGTAIQDHSDSPHNQGGGGIMQYLPLIAVGGLASYLLLRKK